VLNTREMVSVQALSSAMKFFDELTSISNVSLFFF
jgi:hypothetical protein